MSLIPHYRHRLPAFRTIAQAMRSPPATATINPMPAAPDATLARPFEMWSSQSHNSSSSAPFPHQPSAERFIQNRSFLGDSRVSGISDPSRPPTTVEMPKRNPHERYVSSLTQAIARMDLNDRHPQPCTEMTPTHRNHDAAVSASASQPSPMSPSAPPLSRLLDPERQLKPLNFTRWNMDADPWLHPFDEDIRYDEDLDNLTLAPVLPAESHQGGNQNQALRRLPGLQETIGPQAVCSLCRCS